MRGSRLALEAREHRSGDMYSPTGTANDSDMFDVLTDIDFLSDSPTSSALITVRQEKKLEPRLL